MKPLKALKGFMEARALYLTENGWKSVPTQVGSHFTRWLSPDGKLFTEPAAIQHQLGKDHYLQPSNATGFGEDVRMTTKRRAG